MVVGNGSSEEELVEVVFPRSNGWTCPWHPLQFLAWFLLVLLAIMHYGFLAQYVPGLYGIPIFLLPSVVVAVLVFSMVVATSVNPAEANFRRKLSSIETGGTISRAKFNRSKHKHVIENNYCNLCQVHVSAGAKHCRLCDKCVTNFDHHCKWLNNCVGSRNYKWFLAIVWSALLGATLLFTYSSCLFVLFFANRESLRFNCNSPSNLTACAHPLRVLGGVIPDPVFPTLCAVISLLCLVGIGLLGHLALFHVFLKFKGQTTYEYFNEVKEEKPIEVEPDVHSQHGHGRCLYLRKRRRRRTKTNRVIPVTVSLAQSPSRNIGINSTPSKIGMANTVLDNMGMVHVDLTLGQSARSSMVSSSLGSAGMVTFGRTPSPSGQACALDNGAEEHCLAAATQPPSSHHPVQGEEKTGVEELENRSSSPRPAMPTQVITNSNPLPKEKEEEHVGGVEQSKERKEGEVSTSSIPALAKEEVELTEEEVELAKDGGSSSNNPISSTVRSHLPHQLWREGTTSPSAPEALVFPFALEELLSRGPLSPIVSPLEATPTPKPNGSINETLNSPIHMIQKLAFQHSDQQGNSDVLFLPNNSRSKQRPLQHSDQQGNSDVLFLPNNFRSKQRPLQHSDQQGNSDVLFLPNNSRSKQRSLPSIGSIKPKEQFSSKEQCLPPLPFQNPRAPHDAVSVYSTSSYSQLLSRSVSSVSLPHLHNPRHSSAYLASHGSGAAPLKSGGQKRRRMKNRMGKKAGVGGGPSFQARSLPSIASSEYVEPTKEEDQRCSHPPSLALLSTSEQAPV